MPCLRLLVLQPTPAPIGFIVYVQNQGYKLLPLLCGSMWWKKESIILRSKQNEQRCVSIQRVKLRTLALGA